jgi:ribulose-phosphate 3-epimerase
MTQIVPTITAENAHNYRDEIERVAGFAKRIHIDLADGIFAPSRLVNPIQVWWPEDLKADIHMMYQSPAEHIQTLISLNPSLVVLHAESEGDVLSLMTQLKSFGISAGLALLEKSQPQDFASEIAEADHVLIFGGSLGFHGGQAQLEHLSKISEVKLLNPKAEISWDGGINDANAQEIVEAGVDVLNVGGFIQKSDTPHDAYDILVGKLKQ